MLYFKQLEALSGLQLQAATFAEGLRGQRKPNEAFDFDGCQSKVREFVKVVRGHQSELGELRITRILRHRTKMPSGLDSSPDLERHVYWAETVQENVERELDTVARKQTTIFVLSALLLSAIAALASVILMITGV